MLDFRPVYAGTTTLARMAASLSAARLHAATDEMIDAMRAIVADATDADVVFTPIDPDAPGADGASGARERGWTLGRVIVHTTATSEASAALAASLARGLPPEGSARYEVDWRTVTRAKQVLGRLEESRRMRHAFLDAWPDRPHLEVTLPTALSRLGGSLDAPTQFVLGLFHDDAHLGQLREIMRQARAARRVGLA
jgi:hypothetical protein